MDGLAGLSQLCKVGAHRVVCAAEQIFHDDMARRLTGGATKINDVLTGAKAVPGAEYTADVPETWKIRDRTEKPERKAPRVQIYVPEKSSELER